MRTPLLAAFLLAAAVPAAVRADDAPLAEKYLTDGPLTEGETVLKAAVGDHPDDAQARFGLGVVQFVRGVERMAQAFHRYGLKPTQFAMLPFARLPIPDNPRPEPIRYADLRAIFQGFIDDLARAETTLAGVTDPGVKLPIHFGRVRLDLDGDGKAGPDESLWSIYTKINQVAGAPAPNPGPPNAAQKEAAKKEAAKQEAAVRDLVVTFDRGDVAWLRGYCHVLMAFSEVILAHDGKELFDHTAHLFFPRARTPFPFLKHSAGNEDTGSFVDAVAFIHLIRMPVAEPSRATAALNHLEAVIGLSRENWKFVLGETDDDHEWIPNPKQHTVMPRGEVDDKMVKEWFEFLDEAESILKGKTLVPFWRDDKDRGINLRRVFTDPRALDLVLWVQGTAAAPYLQDGKVTSPETWRRLNRAFRGQFVGFAVWFN